MSYRVIAQITESPSLFKRLNACAAQQQVPKPYTQWVWDHLWDIAASPQWADKWAYALASNIEDPGNDEAVITDGDILAVVQYLKAAEATP